MNIITKNSGVEVEIKAASFREAANLKKAAFKCLKDAGILKDVDLSSLKDLNLTGLINKGIDLLLSVDISNELEKNLFECLKSCTVERDGVKNKITQTLFDEIPEVQEDYYEIVSKCIEVNLRPFLKSLVSEFKTRLKTPTEENQQSE